MVLARRIGSIELALLGVATQREGERIRLVRILERFQQVARQFVPGIDPGPSPNRPEREFPATLPVVDDEVDLILPANMRERVHRAFGREDGREPGSDLVSRKILFGRATQVPAAIKPIAPTMTEVRYPTLGYRCQLQVVVAGLVVVTHPSVPHRVKCAPHVQLPPRQICRSGM